MKQMLPKEVVSYLITSFKLTEVNWGLQMKIAKSLLSQYSGMEIIYAINYYKGMGENVYSLGFLKYGDNMSKAISHYKAEMYSQEREDSGARNRERIKQYSQTKRRTDTPEYLFAETGEAD